MKNLLLILCSFLFLNCSENKKKVLKYDTNTIAIIDNKKTEDFKNRNSAILENEDIFQIDKLLKSSVSNYNVKQIELIPKYQEKYPDIEVVPENVVIDLYQYKRQYVPYTNENGEKIVWVYCMINRYAHSNWKKEISFSADGGDCFFRVIINLSNKTYRDFLINGP